MISGEIAQGGGAVPVGTLCAQASAAFVSGPSIRTKSSTLTESSH